MIDILSSIIETSYGYIPVTGSSRSRPPNVHPPPGWNEHVALIRKILRFGILCG